MERILNNKENFKDKEGAWNVEASRAVSDPILDPLSGKTALLRTYAVHKKPDMPNVSKDDILHEMMPFIKQQCYTTGWTFDENPKVYEAEDGWFIRVFCRSNLKLGLAGMEDSSPRSATSLLREAQEKILKKKNK